MRIRTIKPEFWRSPDIVSLAIPTRLHFIGLWNYADDEGRGLDEAKAIAGDLWAFDEKVNPRVVERMMQELEGQGLIIRYRAGGRPYFQITGWDRHQSINRPKRSRIPPAHSMEAAPQLPGLVTDTSRQELGNKGTREQGTREQGNEGTGLARSARERDVIYETLAILEGFDYTDPSGTRPNSEERGKLNRSTALIRQSLGEDLGALRDAIAVWPEVMGAALCTARGVSTNIGRLRAASHGRVFKANGSGRREAREVLALSRIEEMRRGQRRR